MANDSFKEEEARYTSQVRQVRSTGASFQFAH